MGKVKIITWNVNSVRKRLPLILELIKEEDPDFIFLQETKVADELFPPIDDYFAYKSGEKGRNGVAILSKHNCQMFEDFSYLGRLVSVTCDIFSDHPVIFSCLYMYNGFSNLSPKSKKMAMFNFMKDQLKTIDHPIIVGGDFNVVYKENEVTMDNPYEADEIHCYQEWEKDFVNTTPNEQFITWWDYRQNSFQYNKGMGIDKFYTRSLNTSHPKVLRHFRGKDQTSDHAPVKITIDF